ncbi:hypothetical protein BDY19DRAFT_955870 [Irpex rosettiformis]|uniref:Uncharacterized protein n=1 Tax=Irpex rosettiformis TaxID=378272 RepID=A0ACB8TZJ4_9APHY|nr:hypothetical protein BDY19DRAFT_955870 [Irpex rosettiformis]
MELVPRLHSNTYRTHYVFSVQVSPQHFEFMSSRVFISLSQGAVLPFGTKRSLTVFASWFSLWFFSIARDAVWLTIHSNRR